nr:hypothetical protein CFP56_10354 [Quercus suber]
MTGTAQHHTQETMNLMQRITADRQRVLVSLEDGHWGTPGQQDRRPVCPSSRSSSMGTDVPPVHAGHRSSVANNELH